jgi:hypothetical protein
MLNSAFFNRFLLLTVINDEQQYVECDLLLIDSTWFYC